MNDFFAELARQEPLFYGRNASGLPLGDDQGFRDMVPDEDCSGKAWDPLMEVDDRLLKRPIYFNQGFTIDPRLFLRRPAFLQCLEYDHLLQKIGWRLRLCDAYRPASVQQKGFCWGISEVLRQHGESSLEDFKRLLQKAVTKGVPQKERKFLERIVREADQFFLYVALRKEAQVSSFAKKASPLLLTAAANLSLIDLPLDTQALTAHNTGGVVDLEWVSEQTGALVNMGVPVDTPGVIAAFPYFETRVASLFRESAEFRVHRLRRLKTRKAYYRRRVQESDVLQEYLASCQVDVGRFLGEDPYSVKIWKEIRAHRRVVLALAGRVGMLPYGRESWHFDCNDRLGGVRYKRTGEISGGGSYAVYFGQQRCAWGCIDFSKCESKLSSLL